MNYNLHKSLEDTVQQLLNALEPGTFMPIHRHHHSDETCLILRGSLLLKLYNSESDLLETIELNSKKGNFGAKVPAGQWHSIEVLESDTVIFELKKGPYTPLNPEDILQAK
jgi:cupin fold WbuC family metalloprotein